MRAIERFEKKVTHITICPRCGSLVEGDSEEFQTDLENSTLMAFKCPVCDDYTYVNTNNVIKRVLKIYQS